MVFARFGPYWYERSVMILMVVGTQTSRILSYIVVTHHKKHANEQGATLRFVILTALKKVLGGARKWKGPRAG